MELLEVHKISKTYGSGEAAVQALKQASFSVPRGEFVAVVVAVESRDMGRRQEARCVVFPDNFNWDNVFTMPIAKSPSSDYLESFSRAAQPVLSAIRARENASGRE